MKGGETSWQTTIKDLGAWTNRNKRVLPHREEHPRDSKKIRQILQVTPRRPQKPVKKAELQLIRAVTHMS
jgi:hypothetical protein